MLHAGAKHFGSRVSQPIICAFPAARRLCRGGAAARACVIMFAVFATLGTK